jgi:hypothetical protein
MFFVNKIYLQYINTLTSVPDSTKIVPGQPISCRTLAVRGGHSTTSSGHGRYSSEKMAQRKNTAAEGYEIKGLLCSVKRGRGNVDRLIVLPFQTNT